MHVIHIYRRRKWSRDAFCPDFRLLKHPFDFFKFGFFKALSLSFFKKFIYFRERRREGERDGEKHQCVVASHMPPTGDLAHNSGMCPDSELNHGPLGYAARTQSTKLQQPGQGNLLRRDRDKVISSCNNLKWISKAVSKGFFPPPQKRDANEGKTVHLLWFLFVLF